MILPDDVKCKTCYKVFCCSKCRLNHEEKSHPNLQENNENDENKKLNEFKIDCVICCYNQPFILYEKKISDDLLIHMAKYHLPLHCKKCCKIYNSIEDLVIFSKCVNELKHDCNLLECKDKNDLKSNNLNDNKLHKEKPSSSLSNNAETCTSIGIQTSPYLNSYCIDNDNRKNNHETNQQCSNNNKNDNNNDDNNGLTPLSMLNVKSKLKSKCDEIETTRGGLNQITDSASSIRNYSSIHAGNTTTNSNSNDKFVSIETKVGIIRTTTSTPMLSINSMGINQNKGFDASSCHVSSIHITSTELNNNSPVSQQNIQTPPSPLVKSNNVNKIKNTVSTQKIKNQNRPKMHISTTPLRQVMSKSIQRAIVEHGYMRGAYPKKIFDSFDNSVSISINSPLDLRTSPAIRRTRSEELQRNLECNEFCSSSRSSSAAKTTATTTNKVHFTSKKLTTEYLISSTSATSSSSSTSRSSSSLLLKNSGFEKSNTIYKTCHQSIEFVTTTTSGIREYHKQSNKENKNPIVNFNSNNPNENANEKLSHLSVTPKISGSLMPSLKKTISFETPNSNCDSNSNISDEIYYTPVKSYSMIKNTENDNDGIINDDESKNLKNDELNTRLLPKDNISQEDNKRPANNAGGGLWSLLTSVIRFKSFSGNNNNNNKKYENSEPLTSSLIKRCASFAGVLTRSKDPIENDESINQVLKRKRTSSTYDILDLDTKSTITTTSLNNLNNGYDYESPPKRIRKIQGRKPINRMRNFN